MIDRGRQRRGAGLLLEVVRDLRRLTTLIPADWAALLPTAEAFRLLPRLAADAERLGLTSGLPDWACDRLSDARIRGQAFEREVKWEVDRIHRALAPIGIKPVFLKGAAYIAAGLPCGVGRVMADVDILVAEADLARVEVALRDHGWQFEELDPYDERYYRHWMHELPPMRNRHRGTMLDVHHGILPRTGRLHPPAARLLDQAVDVGGTLILSPEHMVLHSAAHLFQDGEVAGALRDVVDLRDLLETFEQKPSFNDRLAVEAEQLGLGRPLYYAVRYARVAGYQGSSAAVARWRPPRVVLALMDRSVKQALTRTDGSLTSLGVFALYARSHWLKMPPLALARHLVRKATRR